MIVLRYFLNFHCGSTSGIYLTSREELKILLYEVWWVMWGKSSKSAVVWIYLWKKKRKSIFSGSIEFIKPYFIQECQFCVSISKCWLLLHVLSFAEPRNVKSWHHMNNLLQSKNPHTTIYNASPKINILIANLMRNKEEKNL